MKQIVKLDFISNTKTIAISKNKLKDNIQIVVV